MSPVLWVGGRRLKNRTKMSKNGVVEKQNEGLGDGGAGFHRKA